MTSGPWRCFHCDEVFDDPAAAEVHFGRSECAEPLCGVTAERYREAERELDLYRTESDARSVEFYRLGAEHAVALRRAEEAGFAAGLASRHELIEEVGRVLESVDHDYQTSEHHHPDHVLIPRAKFEELRRVRDLYDLGVKK